MAQSRTAEIVPFRRKAAYATPLDSRGLMEAVYTAGSLPVSAEDRTTKVMASRLQILGFFVVEEIGVDGSPRRLSATEARMASLDRPWRVSKPGWGGAHGRPDALGLTSFRP